MPDLSFFGAFEEDLTRVLAAHKFFGQVLSLNFNFWPSLHFADTVKFLAKTSAKLLPKLLAKLLAQLLAQLLAKLLAQL